MKFKKYRNLIFAGRHANKMHKKQAYLYPVWTDSQGPEAYNSWTWEDDDDRIKPEEIWR